MPRIGMLEEARRERVTERCAADDDVERLLLDAVPEAHHGWSARR